MIRNTATIIPVAGERGPTPACDRFHRNPVTTMDSACPPTDEESIEWVGNADLHLRHVSSALCLSTRLRQLCPLHYSSRQCSFEGTNDEAYRTPTNRSMRGLSCLTSALLESEMWSWEATIWSLSIDPTSSLSLANVLKIFTILLSLDHIRLYSSPQWHNIHYSLGMVTIIAANPASMTIANPSSRSEINLLRASRVDCLSLCLVLSLRPF